MKKVILFVLLCSATSSIGQQRQFLDYVVKGNDTIFGTIREIAPADYVLVWQGDKNSGKSPVIGLRNAKAVRFNDNIYLDNREREDPIYASAKPRQTEPVVSRRLGKLTSIEPATPDYAVLQNGDTIFGTIGQKDNRIVFAAGNQQLDDGVKSYRYQNDIYTRSATAALGFMKVLTDGKITLLEHTPKQRDYNRIYIDRYRSNDVVYYVQRGNQVTEVSATNFPDSALQVFSDNSALVELIKSKIYSYENMYLIAKFYNQAR